jgi:hypothetical protein
MKEQRLMASRKTVFTCPRTARQSDTFAMLLSYVVRRTSNVTLEMATAVKDLADVEADVRWRSQEVEIERTKGASRTSRDDNRTKWTTAMERDTGVPCAFVLQIGVAVCWGGLLVNGRWPGEM